MTLIPVRGPRAGYRVHARRSLIVYVERSRFPRTFPTPKAYL